MSTRTTLKASTSPFAHLASKPKAADEDEDPKKAKKAKAEDDESDNTEEDGAKGKGKAKKAKADGENGDEDEDPKKAKKAKAEDEEDEEQDKDARAARARERARIRAILVSDAGKANPVAAAHLATGTAMPRGQAIEMLAAMHAGQSAVTAAEPRRDDLRNRMAEIPNPVVGSEGSRPAPNLAEQILAADKKRRGEA